MPSIKTVERNIGNLEGFDVTIQHPDGRDVRSDKAHLPGYKFEKGAKGSMTVKAWKKKRFAKVYAGYKCEVLDAAGKPVHGGTLLRKVRESYHGD